VTSRKRIVYTGHDGGVSVCEPTPEIFSVMQHGGYWDLMPRGYVQTQIDRQIKDGISPDHARRFANAVAFGGCTEAEVWEIIRDRDCARHGVLHELHGIDELPDRWFRDAWRRSANGGPIGIDLEKARRVQWRKIKQIAAEEQRRLEAELDMWSREVDVPWLTIESAIRHARDDGELRKIWPEGLPKL
jgi:hypothetical protein